MDVNLIPPFRSDEQARRTFAGLDVAKLIAAIAVIIIHCDVLADSRIPPLLRHPMQSATALAVPLFFAISGFLCFHNAHGDRAMEAVRTRRAAYSALWLYGAWTLIYFPASMASFVQEGTLNLSAIPRYLHKVVFVGEWQLWFLLSLAWAYALLHVALAHRIRKAFIAIGATVIYGIGLAIQHCQSMDLPAGSPFARIMFLYDKTFASPRVLHDGVFFVCLGMVVAALYHRRQLYFDQMTLPQRITLYALAIVMALTVPAIPSGGFVLLAVRAVAVSLAVTCILLSCLTFTSRHGAVFKGLRTTSAVMYLSHFIFIFCFDRSTVGTHPASDGALMARFMFVLLGTVALSAIVIRLSRRSAFVRKLFRC